MATHLIHVGYPKTGSKFLQRWFRANPQVTYAQWGLAGFGTVFEIARKAASSRLTGCFVTSYEGLAMPLAGYDDFDCRRGAALVPQRRAQERVCTALAELFGGARILIVTRGFAGMIVSLHSELVRGGAVCSLAELAAMLAGLAARGRNPLDYNGVVAAYETAFGADNVHILPYELLARDPASFIAEIELRLGLEPFPAQPDRVRPALSPGELKWHRRLSRAVAAVPLGRAPGERLFRRYIAAARAGRFDRPLRWLGRLLPAEDPASREIAPEHLEAFRGSAECLRNRPHYAGLGGDYLF